MGPTLLLVLGLDFFALTFLPFYVYVSKKFHFFPQRETPFPPWQPFS